MNLQLMQQRDSLSDEELVQQLVLKPNHQDFEVLVNRHQSRLRLYLRGLCGNQAIADELAQETFLKVYRSIAQFKNHSSFKTWSIAIARNTYFDHFRRTKNHGHVVENSLFTTEEALSEPNNESSGVSKEDGILSLDLEKAISRLTESEREVIVHCYFADLTMLETSVTLGIPLGTVKTHASRALAKMKFFLSDWNLI
jgi:RNA polymerase sigma-70 factor (ECF subfamily)